MNAHFVKKKVRVFVDKCKKRGKSYVGTLNMKNSSRYSHLIFTDTAIFSVIMRAYLRDIQSHSGFISSDKEKSGINNMQS
jgi:hypothetical protein